ncbi:MAG TPA: hypothetical protein VKS25_06910, partial [Solirubrobacteraceae bacterium]|nr:hypothetical protein [Solirubrobacteraceae bacterium]
MDEPLTTGAHETAARTARRVVDERREQAAAKERRKGRGRRGNHATTRVTVVIPALNEGPNLLHVLTNMPDTVFEVILIPGSSTDDTV